MEEKMKKIVTGVFGLVCFISVITPLFAQFETAELLGTVRDPSGAAIPGATVTLISSDTGVSSTMMTDAVGNYDFLGVKVGAYSIQVEAPGFAQASINGISANVNAHQRVDVAMRLGTAVESVEVVVTDAVSAVETDSSAHSQVIGTQAIIGLPLNGRAYSSLALLSTNVHISPIAAAFSPSNAPREGAFNVNGMRSVYNNFLMDGLDNNCYGP